MFKNFMTYPVQNWERSLNKPERTSGFKREPRLSILLREYAFEKNMRKEKSFKIGQI